MVVGLLHGNLFAGLFVFIIGPICVLTRALVSRLFFYLLSAQFAECLFKMLLGNGVLLSAVCRDQFAITAEVTGCSSELQGASCCAVFASDAAVLFLRGASDGVTDISASVIESMLFAAARLVSEPQSLIKGWVYPKDSLSASLARDQVAVGITDHVFGNKQEFMDDVNALEPQFEMVLTAVLKTYVGTQSMSITGDSFVLLCSVDDWIHIATTALVP